MLTLELKLDEGVVLTDKKTGAHLGDVKIKSIVQYPTHTGVRLGFDAPQSTYIRKKDFGDDNGNENQK